jgi:hypothetical protein
MKQVAHITHLALDRDLFEPFDIGALLDALLCCPTWSEERQLTGSAPPILAVVSNCRHHVSKRFLMSVFDPFRTLAAFDQKGPFDPAAVPLMPSANQGDVLVHMIALGERSRLLCDWPRPRLNLFAFAISDLSPMRKVAILAGAVLSRPRQMRYYTQYFVPLGVPG